MVDSNEPTSIGSPEHRLGTKLFGDIVRKATWISTHHPTAKHIDGKEWYGEPYKGNRDSMGISSDIELSGSLTRGKAKVTVLGGPTAGEESGDLGWISLEVEQRKPVFIETEPRRVALIHSLNCHLTFMNSGAIEVEYDFGPQISPEKAVNDEFNRFARLFGLGERVTDLADSEGHMRKAGTMFTPSEGKPFSPIEYFMTPEGAGVLDKTFEYVMTNLDKESYTPDDLGTFSP